MVKIFLIVRILSIVLELEGGRIPNLPSFKFFTIEEIIAGTKALISWG